MKVFEEFPAGQARYTVDVQAMPAAVQQAGLRLGVVFWNSSSGRTFLRQAVLDRLTSMARNVSCPYTAKLPYRFHKSSLFGVLGSIML